MQSKKDNANITFLADIAKLKDLAKSFSGAGDMLLAHTLVWEEQRIDIKEKRDR